MTVTRRLPAVFSAAVTAALATVVLAGCASDDPSPAPTGAGGSSSSSSESAPSAAPTDGAKLVTDSTAALGDTESFHISGTIASGSDEIDIDITYGSDGVAQGVLDAGNSGRIELRRVTDGTVYANGSAAFYAQDSDPSGPDLSSIADKWVVVDDSAPAALSGVVSLLDRDDFAKSFEPDAGSENTYEISGPEDVDGQSAYIVTDKDGSTFAVAAEGEPLPIKITNNAESDGTGEIVFDGYGDEVTVDAPADSEIVPIPS